MKGFARAEAQYENRTDDHDCAYNLDSLDCIICGEPREDYEDFDGAPATQEEVTSGYVNPSHARMAAWEQKREAKS